MSRTPSISVVMPVYNAERYVAAAVESILAQTFADFELLVLDDGSTDRSRAILERYAGRDPRVRLVSRPNRGLVRTLNEGLALATGEFIARMDADDVALPERFERQVAFLKEHPEVVCLGGAILNIDPAGRVLIEAPLPQDDATIQEALLEGHCPIAHPTAMIRREAIMAIGGYREEMGYEDFDLWLRLGERGRLANLGEVVLRYRIHPHSYTEKNHDEYPRFMQEALDQACDRRGIERRSPPMRRSRASKDRDSRHEHSVKYGWWGFMRGDRGMALHYALQAIRWRPLRWSGWHLLACTLLKPMPIRKGA